MANIPAKTDIKDFKSYEWFIAGLTTIAIIVMGLGAAHGDLDLVGLAAPYGVLGLALAAGGKGALMWASGILVILGTVFAVTNTFGNEYNPKVLGFFALVSLLLDALALRRSLRNGSSS
ncbi:hypothetical protein [Clavibacter michiganensis]|uniref:hypothetical protein n=1 Tax=Clavibacter michiganensis TaxID=28447 RepID=UPI0026DBB69F|nr:hypothetical protein [Clavibacter michiganensis]MDO4039345.1 hypothetical protein [Clavibacter michiganensis]MDO4063982.1 hypothetical protein [Clavibacter michiganensis]MDO4110159.1 hypothetical protein [Clavibacter michiganensis]MDO4113337.1 hypothetical protein [Clavibacter michiganensis]MDO4116673.1 hypothetical protein [Clavibacter michiganensis]